MKCYKFILNIFISLLILGFVKADDEESSTEAVEITLNPGPITSDYSSKDLNASYDDSSINIQCSGTTCTGAGEGISINEGNVTISAAGTYILQGNLQGQVYISATKDDFIHLVLNGMTISSSNGPAIHEVKCDKLVITTVGENSLIDSENYTVDEDNEPNACLYAKSDLSFNGEGSLVVTGNFDEGIRCKKDLKFISGNINVTSKEKGIKAKNSISFKEATVNVESGDSAIKVTKDDDPEKGFIVIDGGKITVNAGNDGIHAETHLTINGGYIDVTQSKEGLEGQMIDILGGEIYVNANDDGINASKIGAVNDQFGPGGMGMNGFNGTMGGMPGNMGGNPPQQQEEINTVVPIPEEQNIETTINVQTTTYESSETNTVIATTTKTIPTIISEQQNENNQGQNDNNNFGQQNGNNFGQQNGNSFGQQNGNNFGQQNNNNFGAPNNNSFGQQNNNNFGAPNNNSFGQQNGNNFGQQNNNSFGQQNNNNFGAPNNNSFGQQNGNNFGQQNDNNFGQQNGNNFGQQNNNSFGQQNNNNFGQQNNNNFGQQNNNNFGQQNNNNFGQQNNNFGVPNNNNFGQQNNNFGAPNNNNFGSQSTKKVTITKTIINTIPTINPVSNAAAAVNYNQRTVQNNNINRKSNNINYNKNNQNFNNNKTRSTKTIYITSTIRKNNGMPTNIPSNIPSNMPSNMPSNIPSYNYNNKNHFAKRNTENDEQVYIKIVGGKVHVKVDGGDVDGIDSNGSLYIGGEAEVYVSNGSGDIYGNMAALDAEGTNVVDIGATIVVTASGMSGGPGGGGFKPNDMSSGMPSDMPSDMPNDMSQNGNSSSENSSQQRPQPPQFDGSMQNFNSTEFGGGRQMGGMGGGPGNETGSVKQVNIQTTVDSQEAGTEIIVKDSSDNVIISHKPDTKYSKILISTPKLVEGSTYTVIAGTVTQTVTATADSS